MPSLHRTWEWYDSGKKAAPMRMIGAIEKEHYRENDSHD